MDKNILTGHCTECGQEVPVEYLSFLPETDTFYRTLKLNESANENIPANVNSKIMLCPSCMAKYEQRKK